MAANGLVNTGYGESSQVRMYNAYQSRVSTARESYNLAVLNYNNAIKDARLQNNSLLAEIAYKGLEKELELSLAGFQYKNQLLLDQAAKKKEIDSIYHSRYQEVLEQINKENALSEQIRQFEAAQKQQRELEAAARAQQKELEAARLEEEKRQFDTLHSASSTGGSGGGSASITKSSGGSGGSGNAYIAGQTAAKNSIANRVSPARALATTKQNVANMRQSNSNSNKEILYERLF
jgi:hypothetical protein